MSNELHVLFSGSMPSRHAIQTCLRELELPVRLGARSGELASHVGFLPVALARLESGVEWDAVAGSGAIKGYEKACGDLDIACRIDLRWGGDVGEAAVAAALASALAHCRQAIVWDDATDTALSSVEILEQARACLSEFQRQQAAATTGTSPPALRRLLAPLLSSRRDLGQQGRYLTAAPFRHLLRGAFLDRTSSPDTLQLYRFLSPLWAAHRSLGHEGSLHDGTFRTRYPECTDILFDTLRTEVFSRLGPIRSLTHYAERVCCQPSSDGTIAFLLAGERERAIAHVDRWARGEPLRMHQDWLDRQRSLLDRDTALLCRDFHDREAAAVAKMKFARCWNPSPFPVEVSPARRSKLCDEPEFAIEPWPRPPSDLLSSPPGKIGETIFGQRWLFREGQPLLLSRVERQQALALYVEGEQTIAVTRLSGESYVVLRTDAYRIRSETGEFLEPPVLSASGHCLVYGPGRCIEFTFRGIRPAISMLVVAKPNRCGRRWHCNFLADTGEVIIFDDCVGPRGVRHPLQPQAAALLAVQDFGPDAGPVLADHVMRLLIAAGYREV
jgi:hypothetical protein